jgi:UPF0755 protein
MDISSPDQLSPELGHPMSKWGKYKKLFWSGGIFFIFLITYFVFFSAPSDFPTESIFQVKKGAGLRRVSFDLKEKNIIRSRFVFEALMIIYGDEKHIIQSEYFFEKKLSVFEVARRISKGDHHLSTVSLTIPEGFTNIQIADLAVSKLANFDKNKFLLEAREGFLFPDTYFFFPTDTEEIVLKSLSDNFDKKIEPILPEIEKSGKSMADIVVMASIVEKEAKGDGDRVPISSILWKRILLGMPLQADAAPETYKTKGLPAKPISNPGLNSIIAALRPEKSPYLYYLHDKNGKIHFAKTFTEHRQNILTYLK